MSDALHPVYRRILLKLSGESFGHGGKSGISIEEILGVSAQIKRVVEKGVQVAIVVGGGNLLRGAQFSAGLDTIKPATADYMGMIATVMNGLALQDSLESIGVATRLTSAVSMEKVAEPYIRRRAIRHLEKGRVVILAGGTGNPFVTTDTAAALRGRELGVDVVMKATKVDGVYTADPEKDPYAERYERLTYKKVLADRLQVMDISAFEQCMQAKLPILVFNYMRENSIERAVAGKAHGTLITAE